MAAPPFVPDPAGLGGPLLWEPSCLLCTTSCDPEASGFGDCPIPPGTHPSVSKSLGFPSGTPVIWQLPRQERGKAPACTIWAPADLGEGGDQVSPFPVVPERLLFGAASPPPLETGSWQLLGPGMVPGRACNLTASLTVGRQTLLSSATLQRRRSGHSSPQRPPCSPPGVRPDHRGHLPGL